MTSPRRIRGVLFQMGRDPVAIELAEKPFGNGHDVNLLTALYEAISCNLVEKVTISDLVDIVIDEEGAIRDENNSNEPSAFNRTWRMFDAAVDIYGHAVAVGFDEDSGEWVSLTADGVVDACSRVVAVAGAATFAAVHDRTNYQLSVGWVPTIGQARAWIDDGKPWQGVS